MKRFLFTYFFFYILCLSAQQKLRIIFTGDIMVHGPQLKAAYRKNDTYDFSENFIYVKNIFQQADWVIGNLETTLGIKPYSGYPLFSSPPALAEALKQAGFTLVVTANNHALDKGLKGIKQTIRVLDETGLLHTGTFLSLKEKNKLPYVVLEKNGFRIALMNFTYGINGQRKINNLPVNQIDTTYMKTQIRMAKKLQPDEIIVFLHWGKEYRDRKSVV